MTFWPENIDWGKLLKPDFWLEGIAGENVQLTPMQEDGFRNFFLLFFAGLLIIGIFIRLFKVFLPIEHPLQPKLSFWTENLIWMGLLGMLWWLFNQWALAFIGSKIWLLLGLVWFAVLLYMIFAYLKNDYLLEINYYRRKYLQEGHSNNLPSKENKKQSTTS